MNSPIAAYKPQNDLAAIDTSMPLVTIGFGSSQGFELMQRGAKLLSSSPLVPKDYQGNMPSCAIALNMAYRLGADPMMVMQNLYNVHGRPSWSAKFLIATFNQCGRFTSVRYEWKGAEGKPDWGCRAWATEKQTGDRIEGAWITWKMVEAEGWNKRNGSKWLTIPDQMFMYRSAAWMINTHAPELSMGLNTAEELHDVFDAQKDESGNYAVSEGAQSMMDKIRDISSGETIDTKTGEVIQGDPQPASMDKAAVKFGDVSAAMQSAKSLDELNEAYDLAREVKNPVHKQQLNTIYDERSAIFSGEEKL
jgi:hypothetical protein